MTAFSDEATALFAEKVGGSLKISEIRALPAGAIKTAIRASELRLDHIKSTNPCIIARVSYIDGYGVERQASCIVAFKRGWFGWKLDQKSFHLVKGAHSIRAMQDMVNELKVSGMMASMPELAS